MRNRRLLTLALAALPAALVAGSAVPAAAQELEWTADRPDGVAPVDIVGDHTLPEGTLQVKYRYGRMNSQGLKTGTNKLGELDVLALGFTYVPLSRSIDTNDITVDYGVTDAFTVQANVGYTSKSSEEANEDQYFTTSSSHLTDAEVDVLWNVWQEGACRANVQLGGVVPLGKVDERGTFPGVVNAILPYDMQTGSGSWAVVPGATASVQNEFGTVGLQLLGVVRVNDNDRGYRLGNEFRSNLWLAYRFNDLVSASTGMRVLARERISGADPALETFRDPGDVGYSYGEKRVDFPLGLNVEVPRGPLEGNRFGVQFVWTVHEDVDGPYLASDWGFTVGWQRAFPLR